MSHWKTEYLSKIKGLRSGLVRFLPVIEHGWICSVFPACLNNMSILPDLVDQGKFHFCFPLSPPRHWFLSKPLFHNGSLIFIEA